MVLFRGFGQVTRYLIGITNEDGFFLNPALLPEVEPELEPATV